MARIKVIKYEKSEGELKSTFELIEKRRRLSDVLKVQSLHPASIKSHTNFYMDIMCSKTALTRAEKEMIAVIVSAINRCLYCQSHYGAALNAYWKNLERVEQLKQDYRNTGLSEKEIAMCAFSVHLNKEPGNHEGQDFTNTLKEHNLSDEAILDIVLVTSYYNFVNRMVLALGVELEEHGYKY